MSSLISLDHSVGTLRFTAASPIVCQAAVVSSIKRTAREKLLGESEKMERFLLHVADTHSEIGNQKCSLGHPIMKHHMLIELNATRLTSHFQCGIGMGDRFHAFDVGSIKT